jgi:gamma-glutamylcyclotransferase (GGCT)/AIG2-like uncharacterized protein YtfP
MTTHTLFCYGTLMAPQVMQTLLHRLPPSQPAFLSGYVRYPVRNVLYPGIVAASGNMEHTSSNSEQPSAVVKGVLYRDLTPEEMKILDWFEDVEYTRRTVSVTIQKDASDEKTIAASNEHAKETTYVYVWTDPLEKLEWQAGKDWDYTTFAHEHLEYYLEHSVQPSRRRWEQTHASSSTTIQ